MRLDRSRCLADEESPVVSGRRGFPTHYSNRDCRVTDCDRQFQVRWRRARLAWAAYVQSDDAQRDARLELTGSRLASRVRPARSPLRRDLPRGDHVDAHLLPSCLSIARRASGEPALLCRGRRRGALGLSRLPPLPPGPRTRTVANRRPRAARARSVEADRGRCAQRVEHHRVGAAARGEPAAFAPGSRAGVRCPSACAGRSQPSRVRAALADRNRNAGHAGRLHERVPKLAPI